MAPAVLLDVEVLDEGGDDGGGGVEADDDDGGRLASWLDEDDGVTGLIRG
jgi:hypothetical protein